MTSIIVSGIPDICERKDLVEHFELDLDHVLFPLGKDSTRALVAFKSQKAAEDALKQRVVIFGAMLKTRPAPRQTYHHCTANVDGLIVASIPDLQLCIRELQSEFGVDVNFSHDQDTMVLSGSLLQIQCAQTKLDTIFREQQENQARELLMVEQDLTTPRSHRSLAFTSQGAENMGTGLSGTWSGSPSLEQLKPSQSQQEPRYRHHTPIGSDTPQVDAMFSTTSSRSKTGVSDTLTSSKSASLRQSSGSVRQSDSLNKQPGRGHMNTGQAYRREQSLSQEHGFTVKGIKIQRHSSKDQTVTSATLNQERPASETDFHDNKVSTDDPFRHTAPVGHHAWADPNTRARPPPRVPSPRDLVLPPEGEPQKHSKNGRDYMSVKVELDLDVMGYIKKIHKAEVKEIEQRHHVQCSNRWLDGVMEVRITTALSEEEGGLDKLSAARKDFVSFYQTVFYSVVKDTVTYKPSRVPESEVDAVTTAVGKAFASRVYVNSTTPGEIVLVGSWDYLPLVKDWVNKKMAEVKVANKGQTAKTKGRAVTRVETKAEMTHTSGRVQQNEGPSYGGRSDKTDKHINGLPATAGSPKSPVFEHKTSEGLRVLIYKADITRVTTQAIVNASNDSLHHIGAIALAISEAAGPQLQKECTDYINKNGPMRVSEVMSTPAGGRLPSDHVIHSVGPMWCLYTNKERCADALRQTFLNTFYYANNKLKVVSLSTPAISSGVYGVPLDVCTQALYSAIQAFSPAATNLKEVHVVDLEEDAAGMMSIIFQQLAEGEGLLFKESDDLRVEDIETEAGVKGQLDASQNSKHSGLALNGDHGELREDDQPDFTQKTEALIQPSRREAEFMSAPPRLQIQESSDWPESPPPSPDSARALYSPSLNESDYEEPVVEEMIQAAKVDDIQAAPGFASSFDELEATLESLHQSITSQTVEERSHHSQQGSREASFHSTKGDQSTRQHEYQSPRQPEYQSPRQQEYQSPRLRSPHVQSPRQEVSQMFEVIAQSRQQNVSDIMSPRQGQVTQRSGQATPRNGLDTAHTNRSGVVTPRSGQVTPKSGQVTPRSDQIAPRSSQVTPRSGRNTPQSGQMAPRSGQMTPRSGHINPQSGQMAPRSGQMTPRSGQMTPRSGHMTPRSGQVTPRMSGQTTPKSSHLLQEVDLDSPKARSVGTLTPCSQDGRDDTTPARRSGVLSPRSEIEDTVVKAQAVDEMFSQPPVSPEQPVVPRSTPAVESSPWSEGEEEEISRQSSAMQESLPDTETQLLKLAHQQQQTSVTDFLKSSENPDQLTRPKVPESTLSELQDQTANQRIPLLIRLVASALCIAETGGEIIRSILQQGDLGIVQKTGINDLQTKADRTANASIVTSLRQHFPGIEVIGEEDEEGEVEIAPKWLKASQSQEVLQYMRELPDHLREINIEDIVVWVDPLDGTKEYTQGLLDHVTVLIGISVKGRAVGGIIHQPYYNYQQGPDAPMGRSIWGIIGVGAFGFTLTPPATGSNIVCTTRSHSNKNVNMAVESCQPTEVLRVGGSGHKVLLLLEGAAHAYVFASPGTKKWDTCAPEAVLHAVGGKLTDMHGNYYSYDERVNKQNMGGVLATAVTEQHAVYLTCIPQEVKNELPTDGPAIWQMAHQITTRLQHMQVPLVLRILAAAVSVSEKAGEIVRDIMRQGDLGIVEKGVNDLQTEADRSAEVCIVSSLKKQFPDVTVIGEEEDTAPPTDVRSDWLHSNQSEAVLEFSGQVPEELRDVISEEVTVWVDPLDGTAEYTQGLLDHVTVLIGISVRGRAVAGAIYQPFYNYQAGPNVPLGRTIWGMIGVGSFGFTKRFPPEGQNIVCTTRSHSNKNVNMAVESCQPTEVLRVGGSGHKVLLLLEGAAHAYVFASPGTKKWDTCAPEAVLHAVGGKLTDMHGNYFSYGKGVNKKNMGGVLATAGTEEHAVYLTCVPQEVKNELPTDGPAIWQMAHQITTCLQHIEVPLVLRILAAAVSVSEKAGEIVRDIMRQGDLGIVEKGVNDLQTEADRSAEVCIVSSLKKQFPDVTVIGEEEDTAPPTDVRSDWLHSNQSEAVLEFSGQVPDELRDVIGEDVTVWVDPLDGTAEYTQGLLDHVTVLIGISVSGRAVAGTIYQPFYNYQAGPNVPLGRTIWGMVGVGSFGFTKRFPPEGQNIVCTTRSHSNKNVNMAVESCQPTEVLRVGGSGHKVLLLLEGAAHAYVFASPGTKKWDTCAPEAVLHAVGGKLTDLHGNQYQYGAKVEKKNKGGVLATAQVEPHARYVQAIPDEVKEELPSDGLAPWQQQEE